jgi:hypothetical protein
MDEVTCKRCSLCCHLVLRNDEGEKYISNKLCKFCIPVGNNRYICKIYKTDNRIGHDIGEGNFCHKRTSIHLNYVGCPYNHKEWGKEFGVGDVIEDEEK